MKTGQWIQDEKGLCDPHSSASLYPAAAWMAPSTWYSSHESPIIRGTNERSRTSTAPYDTNINVRSSHNAKGYKPSKLRLAALTIASISRRVISPWLTISDQWTSKKAHVQDPQKRYTIQESRIRFVLGLFCSFECARLIKSSKRFDVLELNVKGCCCRHLGLVVGVRVREGARRWSWTSRFKILSRH